jgi:hypothetical protein
LRLPSAITFACFFLNQSLFAQEETIQPISTSIYSDNRVILPLNATYRLPSFTKGTIVYRNGTKFTVKLNYNLARDEMHFINATGDTMRVADPPTINTIAINHNRFYYFKDHYLQLIRENSRLLLAFRQEITVHIFNSAGPYASTNDLSAINNTGSNPESASINGLIFHTDDGRRAMMLTTDFYYLGDGFGNFSKATKAVFLQYYEKDKKAIGDFINERHINFDKLADLLSLLNYCTEFK